MRILILATPRSGSTSLVKLVNSHITISDYKMLIEPFNSELDGYLTNIDSIIDTKNLLIKNLFLVENDEYPTDSFNNVYEYFEWCYKFFDKIILLDRKDKVAQSESFAINETLMRERGIDWHTPKIYDTEKIESSYIETMISRYTKSSDILHKMSNEHNFPLFYYEDIFLEHNKSNIKNLFNHLNIQLDDTHYKEYVLSPNRRVRINKNKQNLI
jgi:hypothetical protein